jgi:cytoskeletal protein RodZ
VTTQETQVQIESIGARLNRARLRKKLTVDQVYKDIKIHPKIIAALEEDRYEEFMSSIYIKAFLKSYCRYLDIDANRIMADYDKLRKQEPNIVLEIAPKKEAWIFPVAAGVIVFFIALFLITLTAKGVKGVVNAKSAKSKATAPAESKEAASIKPLSIPASQNLTLIVKTKGDVWLSIKSDDKTVFKSTLKKGSVETYRADNKFQLWTGKGEYVDLTLNGNPLGSPGNGVIRNISLTREGLTVEKK